MASPVDTSVKHAISTMTGAPTLSGTAGSLIGLLDAVLVNGWGLQTATSVVVAGGVATATFSTAFPATVDSVIQVAGATPSGLNGEQKVTALGANLVRFATAEADGTATGTITVKMAAAGWSKAFSGTNKAAYRSLDPQAHAGGMYLRVDDTGTTSCRVIGYESMTDVDTGTGPFPTNAQVSGGGFWAKSNLANATAIRWAVIADSRFFIISIAASVSAISSCTRGFGDLISLRPTGDVFATVLNVGTSASSYDGPLDLANANNTYAARGFTGLGSSAQGRIVPYVGSASSLSGGDSTLGAFPNPYDGGLYLSRRFWNTGNNQPPRANCPGLLSVPQAVTTGTFSPYSTIDGAGDFTGRRLFVLDTNINPGTGGLISLVDITGPWR